MNSHLSRRTFLKLAATGSAALAVGELLPPAVAQAARAAGMINARGNGFVHSMCEMCVWRCGLIAKVRNGRVVKLDGNPDHPHSRGNLCVRGQSGVMTTYDPDRVLTPLIRTGQRGEGQFREASWDEALDLVAERMLYIKRNYGPEAMVFSSTHSLSQLQFENLLYGFGSPNYGTQRSLCFNAMIVANLMTYGMEEPERIYDENLQYILLTGRNLFEAVSTSETGELSDAIARGAKVVYLDPRFTKTAAKAAEWLPIKPGTDLAFHLAVLNCIIADGAYDAQFVADHTIGFSELAAEVESFTPEWAAPITEIPAETIRRIAREFAAAAPHALAHNGWRTSNFVNSFQTQRAISILNALVGNWNVHMKASSGEHSGALGRPPQPPYPRMSALRLDGVPYKYPVVPLKIGVFQELRDNILTGQPYQARGWFVSRQNPVMSLPDRGKTLEAISRMEFIATVDISLNDTAWYSDVVLPESSYLERYDPLLPMGDRVFIRQPVIEPQGDTHSALWIYKQLGERLGLGDYFQYDDEEDYLRQQLAPLGISLEDVRQRGYAELPHAEASEPQFAWNTPSGKIELHSQTLARVGFAGVPTWEPPPEPPTGQFYLLTGKVAQATQFATQNNLLLDKYADEPRLWLSSRVAEGRGLRDGDWVEVTSAVGQVNIRILATPGIRDDCVYLTPGYGHLSKALTTAYGVGASDSALHVTYTDPVSGGQALSQTFVTVRKV